MISFCFLSLIKQSSVKTFNKQLLTAPRRLEEVHVFTLVANALFTVIITSRVLAPPIRLLLGLVYTANVFIDQTE